MSFGVNGKQTTKRRQSVIWLGFKASESQTEEVGWQIKWNILCVSKIGHWAKIHPSWCSALLAGWLAAQWSGEENSYSHTSSNDFLVEINWMKFVFFEKREEKKTCIVGMATRRRKYFYHFCKKNGKVLNENGILPTWTGVGVHASASSLRE